MNLFDFIEKNQKVKTPVSRPSREETLKQAEEMYAKYPQKFSAISREEYLKNVLEEYNSLINVSDEEYEAQIFQKELRSKKLLKDLDSVLAKKIEEVKKHNQDKENRKITTRIKNLLKRILKL